MDINRRKQQSQQPRQLLSCTKCRERKVKCDRTKPCSACCARGAPKECHFVAEGGDYAPIQQSYELRKLRAENLRLKERLRTHKVSLKEDDSDQSSESQPGDASRASTLRKRQARQRRFQGSEWSDSIYFGSPGLANIVADFASVNLKSNSSRSLAYNLPRGPDIFTPQSPSSYPFATLFPATPEECIPQLLDILPCRKELLEYLAAFEKRVYICAFPHLPMELTESEIERFLCDPERNARLCPDMLALIFAAIALGAQFSVWDKSGQQWKPEMVDAEAQRGNVYVAASMQALRIASFMHKPSLLAIESLIIIGPFLSNSGRYLDAWTLFGTTIRMAHAIGLHRHPKYLDLAPATQTECSIRQTLWWWMLHMDEQYSMTLGRPLGISGIGDCPPPHELTTNPQMLRLGEFINHFTILSRQILSSDRLSNSKIDKFTDLLMGLQDTMPEMLQFDATWLDENKTLPDWPLVALATVYYCKTHTYLILLNRQRIDEPEYPQAAATRVQSSFRPVNKPTYSQSSPAAASTQFRGKSLTLTSSAGVVTAFLFFYSRAPALLISWTLSQQAFNSAMILLLDALETSNLSHLREIEQAYVVFKELQDNGVHKLAGLAVEKLSWGLDQLRKGMGGLRRQCSSEIKEPPGAVQHNSKMGPTMFQDTVMGNAGMLIPEEPSLQSCTSERFAFFTWGITGAGSEAATPYQVKVEEAKELHLGGNMNFPNHLKSEGSGNVAPGLVDHQYHSEPSQRRHGALLAQDAFQSQCHIAEAASPIGFAGSVLQQSRNNVADGVNCSSCQKQTSHRPSGRITPPTALSSERSPEEHVDSSVGAREPGTWSHPPSIGKLHRVPVVDYRHSSCPSLHDLATSSPLSRSSYSSPLSNRAQTPVSIERDGAHTQWSGNPAAPTLGSHEPGMFLSPMSEQGENVPNYHNKTIQQQRIPESCSHSHSLGPPRSDGIPTTVEQMTVDQWKRWAGSGVLE